MAIPTPLAVWNMNETSGNASDASGNGYTLTNTGSVAYTTGLLNNAANLNADGKYLRRADNMSLTNTTSFSFSTWIKIASEDTQDHDIFAMWQDGNPTGWYFRGLYEYNGGTRRLRFFRSGSTTTFLDINGNIGDNTWHHIGFTYNGSSGAMKLYKDISSTTTGGASTGTGNQSVTASFDLGDTAGSGYTSTLNGLMDVTKVWNVLLTDAEMTEDYNSGAGKEYPFLTNSGFFMLI